MATLTQQDISKEAYKGICEIAETLPREIREKIDMEQVVLNYAFPRAWVCVMGETYADGYIGKWQLEVDYSTLKPIPGAVWS